MKAAIRFTAAFAAAVCAVVAAATPAGAFGGTPARAVFVQTDNTAGNQVVVYDRAPGGTLTKAGTYATGGRGGQLAGSVVDHLASQSSLVLDRATQSLYAVNAGSDTVSVFGVRGDRLRLEEIVPSGGTFPVSIAVGHGLVYVVNALGGGSVQGYRQIDGLLIPIPGSNRRLGLDPTASPQFVNTPGQVSLTPNGSQLIVTTKANGSSIDVFAVTPSGRLGAPVVTSLPGAVPFAVTYDASGHVIVAEAGTNALASFALAGNGTLTQLAVTPTGEQATCWVVGARGYFYVSNAGSGVLSDFSSSLALLASTPTDGGTVDAAATPRGRFLYVQTGALGIVDEFAVAADGSLTEIGSVTVPNAVGGEGIAAS